MYAGYVTHPASPERGAVLPLIKFYGEELGMSWDIVPLGGARAGGRRERDFGDSGGGRHFVGESRVLWGI